MLSVVTAMSQCEHTIWIFTWAVMGICMLGYRLATHIFLFLACAVYSSVDLFCVACFHKLLVFSVRTSVSLFHFLIFTCWELYPFTGWHFGVSRVLNVDCKPLSIVLLFSLRFYLPFTQLQLYVDFPLKMHVVWLLKPVFPLPWAILSYNLLSSF